MQGTAIPVIIALPPFQPHDVQAIGENSCPLEVGEALHLNDILIQQPTDLEFHDGTCWSLQTVQVEELAPNGIVLNPPARISGGRDSRRRKDHFVDQFRYVVVNSPSAAAVFVVDASLQPRRNALLLQDSHGFLNKVDNRAKSRLSIVFPWAVRNTIELV